MSVIPEQKLLSWRQRAGEERLVVTASPKTTKETLSCPQALPPKIHRVLELQNLPRASLRESGLFETASHLLRAHAEKLLRCHSYRSPGHGTARTTFNVELASPSSSSLSRHRLAFDRDSPRPSNCAQQASCGRAPRRLTRRPRSAS